MNITVCDHKKRVGCKVVHSGHRPPFDQTGRKVIATALKTSLRPKQSLGGWDPVPWSPVTGFFGTKWLYGVSGTLLTPALTLWCKHSGLLQRGQVILHLLNLLSV